MTKNSDKENFVVETETSHRCSLSCLGPLTFHPHVVGDKIRLSKGSRLAERRATTFKNGLVFSSRPLRIQERIRLRVERDVNRWQGALRVGFTNVSPSARSLPLPVIAIPNLTDTPGHWAAPVPESLCQAGSELEFWVSHGGNLYISSNNTLQHRLLTGVDLSWPLWAMIDVYGQTCSIFLLGSVKKGLCSIRRSCPAPEYITSPDIKHHRGLFPGGESYDCRSCVDKNQAPADGGSVMVCVVCLGGEARVTLSCGHKCLCTHCAPKVLERFGFCPLCRQDISASSVGGMCMSVPLSNQLSDCNKDNTV